ncbi:DUF2920 family protein [Campylobacter jejuni]|nr:DUF2920 family protein [Campylobacter jejuni]
MPAIDHINALKDLVKRLSKICRFTKIYGGGLMEDTYLYS